MKYLYENDLNEFKNIMTIFAKIITSIMPNKYPMYMKDKLNINYIGGKFKLHQDCAAGWKDKFGLYEYITIGIPIIDIISPMQGPTRICIRQGYNPEYALLTENDKTIKEEKINELLGRELQYLNIIGKKGNIFLFNDSVLHDSGTNIYSDERSIFFATFAIVDNKELLYSFDLADKFYNSKVALDKKKIEELICNGLKPEDFIIDTFGKINKRTNEATIISAI